MQSIAVEWLEYMVFRLSDKMFPHASSTNELGAVTLFTPIEDNSTMLPWTVKHKSCVE